MKKVSLSSKGLSLSQAQSISNLCYQKAIEIGNKLSNVNNYSKEVISGDHRYILVKGKKIPSNVVDLLIQKSTLHACQAFLMENIKAKDDLLELTKRKSVDISNIEYPKEKEYLRYTPLPMVDENFGWEQLSVEENAEYLEAEAFASHIGQFFHKGSVLDNLRKELPEIPDIEWMTIKDGEKSPIEIKTHHTSEELLILHEELANIHRKYEQKVNYFKSKVKNITTSENSRIANVNANAEAEIEKINNDRRTEFDLVKKKFTADVQSLKLEFEKERQSTIKTIVDLRIEINPRFQDIINSFLNQFPESQV